ncbi:MAG: helix-turn-helix transcriptional regulator [Desulfobacterales bacterium]|nr:helix-turn-helix transcriptional regulator [Desulfobacterales bacterium]
MKVYKRMTDKSIAEELGDRVKKFRLNKNWTQKDIAEFSGISLKAIQNAEKGSCTLLNYIKVLRALGLVEVLDSVIPEAATISPLQLAKMGKSRQRARSTKNAVEHQKRINKILGV